MIQLKDMTDDQFRICMETISRMGVMKHSDTETTVTTEDNEEKVTKKVYFYQSCYIVKFRGGIYIAYWKEILNKKMEDRDFARANTIALLLANQWKLCELMDPSVVDKYGVVPKVKVIPFKDKNKYERRNVLTGKHLSNFIQIQIRKSEVERASKENVGEQQN